MTPSSIESPRSRRRLTALASLTVVLLAGATWQTGSVAASASAPGPIALDLPAMVVRPTDIAGQPYGIHDGYFMSPPSGGVAEYWASVSLPDPTGETLASRVNTIVTQYRDDVTAQGALESWRQEMVSASQDPSSLRRLVDGAPVVGDDSVATLYTPTLESGVAINVIEIQFRSGTVVGDVSLSDFSGAEIAFEQIQPLATAMIAHIGEVVARAEVGISHRALRVGELNLSTDYEAFSRVDGVTQRWSGEADDQLTGRDSFLTASKVDDMYTLQQTIDPAGTGDPAQLVGYTQRIFRFASEVDAAAFVDLAIQQVLADPGSYMNPAEVAVSGFPGPARGISFSWDYGDGLVTSGFRIWAQTGVFVVSAESDAVAGAQQQGVIDLTNAQIACLATDQPCAAIQLPATVLPAA